MCALFTGVVFALDQDEALVSPMWSSETFYQGSNVTVTVFFVNLCSEELTVYSVGLHFDWMPSDSFVGLDMSNSPVIIPSNGDHIFNPMIIHIPEDVSAGSHNYFIRIEGLQGESSVFSWDDPYDLGFLIQDSEEANNEDVDTDSQQDQLLIIVGVIVVVVVTVLIIILTFRREKTKRAGKLNNCFSAVEALLGPVF
jgi:hypothetical protein